MMMMMMMMMMMDDDNDDGEEEEEEEEGIEATKNLTPIHMGHKSHHLKAKTH